ncbi:c-type cytochrome [Pararcticibacter amylolyticus]|uniref:Cytochrome c domain-containing protein n=1 Tax=Pararcticibacter amylolyticus TaxID=2173175 RepID=A0A2U2PH90_9SPHI|nr:cytochrome c [Pararcticibacter amylolyticus]PWG80778.1 hypothetical protein DDR33_09980 [Pararcticibacter amylolyticus]
MRLFFFLLLLSLFIFSCGRNKNVSSKEAKNTAQKAVIEKGRVLFEREDCSGCHAERDAIIGPSFRQLAGEYAATDANISHLANMAIIGVKPEQGIWGSREMTPHPHLKQEDAEAIIRYMLSFPADPKKPFLHNTK